jgi:hypothetical protein
LNEIESRIQKINHSINQLRESHAASINKKNDIRKKSAHLDQEINAIMDTATQSKQLLDQKGIELIAAKQALSDWTAQYEEISKSISKMV